MQEVRRLKPSTVSRRTSIVAGLYRTAVIDGLLEHSPAEHVPRPPVSAESPTLGLTHLQLEALLTAARQSPNRYDFALVCLLGLLDLRIFQATGLNIADLGEEHGHRVLRVAGKGDKTALIPLPRLRVSSFGMFVAEVADVDQLARSACRSTSSPKRTTAAQRRGKYRTAAGSVTIAVSWSRDRTCRSKDRFHGGVRL